MSWRVETSEYTLQFIEAGGTSRGVMYDRTVWYLKLYREGDKHSGLGECAPLFGLSAETQELVEDAIEQLKLTPEVFINDLTLLKHIPSLRFALEMALIDYKNGGKQRWFDTAFYRGKESIKINGLIWMGTEKEMIKRIESKLDQGFSCLKLKIGAIDFKEEVALLERLRERYSPSQLEIRLDANGAFLPEVALEKLTTLSDFSIHSIEQPIKAEQLASMRELCELSPIDIALDEELIGVVEYEDKLELLKEIKPKYIIIKPTLLGGFEASKEWIDIAESLEIGWWITSALESNVGLDAIAQWASTFDLKLPQGLGTGQVFSNNKPSNLYLEGEHLHHKV